MNEARQARTGIDRFYERYPNYPRPSEQAEPEYLGVGAPMIDPTGLTKEAHCDKYIKSNE